MFFFLGGVRHSSSIQQSVVNQPKAKRFSLLKAINEIATEAYQLLSSNLRPQTIINEWAKLLHQGWALKKSLSSQVTSDEINSAYEYALSCGAVGGKLCGAGGGGFLLLIVPPEHQDRVQEKLKPYKNLKFQFTTQGTRLIYHQGPPHQTTPTPIDLLAQCS